jgi:hypothetical protein
MIVGGVVVAIIVIVVAISRLGGSSTSGSATTPAPSASTHASKKASQTHATHTASEPATPAVGPAETPVTVLNGTETNGLAHDVAAGLQQDGYARAVALGGTPPGSHAVTVVEYATGHRAEAKAVAKAASVNDVLPMENAVAALSNSATVVVVVGADKATSATTAAGEESAATGANG